MNSSFKKIKLALAVSVALGLSGCGEQSSNEYLAQGQQALEQSNVQQAIIEFKNAVRLAPKDANARIFLGEAYLAEGSYQGAEKELSRAIELGASKKGLVLNLATVRAKLADRDGLKLLLENSSALEEDEYVGVLFYVAVAALNDNDLNSAQDFFGQTISLSKEGRFGKLAQAYLLYSEQKHSESQNFIKELLSVNANDKEATLLNGHLYFAQNEFNDASNTFAHHLTLAPKDYAISFFQINALLRADNYEEAETKVDGLLKRFKEAPLAHQYKSQIEYHKNNYREAITHADKAIKTGAGFPIARMVAGVSAYQLKEFEQSYDYLKPIEGNLTADHPIQKMLAIVKLKLGYINQASENFSLLEGLTTADVELLQASSVEMMKASDFQSAQKLIEKAEQLDPTNALLAAQKGMFLLSQDNVSGIEALEHALTLDSSLEEVELALAMQYLKLDEEGKAQEVASKWLKNNEQSVSGHILQGIIYTKQNNISAAKISFENVLSIEDNNIAALYNLAILAENDEDFDRAEVLYKQTLALLPSHKGALQNLSVLQLNKNQKDQHVSYLESLAQESNENISLTLTLAQNYRAAKQTEKAISLLESISNHDNLPQGYWLILGDAYVENKQLEKASKIYKNALTQLPNSYLLTLRNIGVLELGKKYPQALSAVYSASEKFPDNIRLQMLSAHYELLNKNYSKSEQIIKAMNNRNVKHEFLDKITGDLAIAQGNYPKAISFYSMLYQQEQSSKNAVRLARALKFNGQQQEAEKTLESYLAENDDTNTRVVLASLYQSKDSTKKIKQYQLILKEFPDNIIILNNLAWSQYQINDLVNARENIEKAYAIQGEFLPLVETYAAILVKSSDNNMAFKLLEKAQALGTKDAELQISLAKAYIDKGNNDKAKTLLNSITDPSPELAAEAKSLKASLN
ncbi:XrtA/PEP-CTERM system TPR-repeat protein PrsT [Colwelliaceae bacterium 6441]